MLVHLSWGWDTVGAFSGGSLGCTEHSDLGLFPFLLIDQGRGCLETPNQPQLSFQIQCYLPSGEELDSQAAGGMGWGLGRQLPQSSSFFWL